MIEFTDHLQRVIYESLSDFGPLWSALAAGFAVVIGDEVLLTPAGERYLLARGDDS